MLKDRWLTYGIGFAVVGAMLSLSMGMQALQSVADTLMPAGSRQSRAKGQFWQGRVWDSQQGWSLSFASYDWGYGQPGQFSMVDWAGYHQGLGQRLTADHARLQQGQWTMQGDVRVYDVATGQRLQGDRLSPHASKPGLYVLSGHVRAQAEGKQLAAESLVTNKHGLIIALGKGILKRDD